MAQTDWELLPTDTQPDNGAGYAKTSRSLLLPIFRSLLMGHFRVFPTFSCFDLSILLSFIVCILTNKVLYRDSWLVLQGPILSVSSPSPQRDEGRGAMNTHRGFHNRVVLFKIGEGITIVNFGLFAALGGALAMWVGLARQFQAGLRPDEFAPLLYGLLPLLIVLGSRIFVLALEWRELLRSPWETLRRPGFAFQGGFLLGAAGLILIALKFKLDLLLLMDTVALAIPLGHAFGRLGCFTYGCCHGKPTRSRLAVRYTNPESKPVRLSGLEGVALHPTQLYSAMLNLLIFLFLNWFATRGPCPGQLAGLYLLIEGAGRFGMEFLRGIPVKRVLGLSIFQWVSVPLFIAGILLFWIASSGTPHALFARTGDFFDALIEAGRHFWYFLWFFVIFFIPFGVHGRRVGKL